MAASLYPRLLRPRLEAALNDTPVVLLNGPRQAGGYRYLTLDDAATLASARTDPVGLVRWLDRAVIDEVQRAPGLLLAIKQVVDADRRPGRFLLTRSAHLMTVPGVADPWPGVLSLLRWPPARSSGPGAAGSGRP